MKWYNFIINFKFYIIIFQSTTQTSRFPYIAQVCDQFFIRKNFIAFTLSLLENISQHRHLPQPKSTMTTTQLQADSKNPANHKLRHNPPPIAQPKTTATHHRPKPPKKILKEIEKESREEKEIDGALAMEEQRSQERERERGRFRGWSLGQGC